MIRSFRWRLTLWYLGFFSLLFVLFGLFLYGRLSGNLKRRLDDELMAQARTAATLFADEIPEQGGKVDRAAREIVSNDLHGQQIAIFDGDTLLSSSGPATAGQ